MMSLSIMRDFFEDKEIVNSLLEKWGYDKDSVQFFRASSNFVLTFEKDKQKYILRITPNGSFTKLKNEVDFLLHLSENNLRVNKPLPTLDNKYIEIIDTKLGTFHAVVFPFFKGNMYDIEQLNEDQFFTWGATLGKLHAASQKTNQMNYSLQTLLSEAEQQIPSSEVDALHELQFLQQWLKARPITNENFGRLHFDIELDNLIWDETASLQIIDFESTVDGWFVADIAFALRDLFNKEIDLLDRNFLQFINGYTSQKSLTEDEITSIPMFLRLHQFLLFTDILETVDIENSDKNPDWLEELLFKLTTKLDSYRKSFKIGVNTSE